MDMKNMLAVMCIEPGLQAEFYVNAALSQHKMLILDKSVKRSLSNVLWALGSYKMINVFMVMFGQLTALG